MLKFYNSALRKKQDFNPIDANHIKMYVCGPTVYDDIHIGNARPIVVFDSIFRLLQIFYKKVSYVRNITDIDDKIIIRANENNESINTLTTRVTSEYHKEIAKLNCLTPTIEPKATENILEMQALITKLIELDFAYIVAEHVFFAVDKYNDYGALSGISQEEIIAGARIEVNSLKRNSSDFVLWKPAKEHEIGYSSPWFSSLGRPGWHIECSAMASKHLGNHIDIHGGGKDLLFPHHENERAQSVCASGGEFARYWLHNGYLMVDGKKMSKSLGNFLTLKSVNQKYHGEVVRLALLMTHYRQPLDFKESVLDQAKTTLEKFYKILDSLSQVNIIANDNLQKAENKISVEENYLIDFIEALSDDFNTPKALAVLHQSFAKIVDLQKQNTKLDVLQKLCNQIVNSANLLGILCNDSQKWLQEQSAGLEGANGSTLDEAEILNLIAQRQEAKSLKNYALADSIRQRLEENNIILKDTVDGTNWYKK